MRKQIALIMVTVCVLLMAGCGDSNSSEDSAGTDNQIKMTYVENAGQADTEENISTDGVAESPLDGVTDDAAKSSEAQEPTKEEDWEDKALLEEYAAYGIEKDGDFYYNQGELE